MENMLGNLRWQICLCYLDDVIIYSPDFPTHLKRLEAVFRCFRESNLRLNDKKCRFAFEELEILGYITSKHGIKPAEHNIKVVRNFPRPKKVKEVQSFLGMCSYYRKFIKDFSKIADPLTNLIKKSVSFTWTERQEEAFQTLKTALLSPPILGHFNPNAPTYVHTDASNIGIGATLVQDIGGEEKVISYLSRTLSKAEQNYSTTEKECLAVVWSMSKLRPYLYGRHFKIVTDHHALCWLKNLKDPTGRLARWALNIQEYDFILPPNLPFKRIGIDFVGPLPSTKNRKKWIIVLTDYYTSYAETRAVSEATVKEVSKFLLEDIFLRHGVP
ncbi:K02A2.6-like [Cordylochernes scorpioides]|uniref:K02A2.6-like n=1 Tax=Cordylochernes scorpioides TaxID=51811 RepID=A0ABY6KYR0_9ARAC|nr:K02A2.6-like [Cordylochernes scorpioides]